MGKIHKLLVIGAGIGQVPMMQKAKSRGIPVAAVTLPGDFPGLALADEVFYCDIYDRDAVAAWAKDHGITAVISDQNDLMNPTVAYVAEKLGLPGNRFDQVMSYCNKNIYRSNCDRLGIPVPRHMAVDSEDFDISRFACPLPWIVKPADSQSSVGVQRIDCMEEWKPALAAALRKSKTHSAIVEEFFVGKEIVCEGFIENGSYRLLAFADRRYFDLKDLMIPSQTLFPSVMPSEWLDQVVQYEQRMAEYICPSFAIVHSEYLINEEIREIRVVESALRGGGVYISSHLIPLATGIDINDILLDKALGASVDWDEVERRRKQAAAGYACFYLPEGRISAISGAEALEALPFVQMVCLDDMTIGKASEKMLHKGLRKGPILVSGRDRADLERNIQKVQETLHITVTDADGRQSGMIWN